MAQINIKAEIQSQISALNVRIKELRALEIERDLLQDALRALEKKNTLLCHCEYGDGCSVCRRGKSYR